MSLKINSCSVVVMMLVSKNTSVLATIYVKIWYTWGKIKIVHGKIAKDWLVNVSRDPDLHQNDE